jgi:hypothetical protein
MDDQLLFLEILQLLKLLLKIGHGRQLALVGPPRHPLHLSVLKLYLLKLFVEAPKAVS